MILRVYSRTYLRPARLLAGGMLLLIACTGCRLGRMVQPPLDSISARVPEWGQAISSGLVAGLDTARVDSLVARLLRLSVRTLEGELDSVQLDALERELNTTLQGILRDNLRLLQAGLTDPATFDTLRMRLRPLAGELTAAVDRALRAAVPTLLNEENLARIYRLRDSLLGPTTALLLEEIINQNVERALTNPRIDELLIKVRDTASATTGDIDRTARGISRTVLILGGALALLLILTIVLSVVLRRKWVEAQKQEELLVNITKAIDAIPQQDAYDLTTRQIRKQLTQPAADPELNGLLDRILEKHQGEYPEKRKYRSYYQRLLQLIREADPSGAVSRQVLSRIDDNPDFKDFAEKELRGS